MVGRLRMPRLRRPLHVEGAVERRGPGIAAERRIGTQFQQAQRQVEVPVDRRDEQGARPVGRADPVDVSAAVDKPQRRVRVAFAGSDQQRRESAVGPDEIREAERLRLFQEVRLDGCGLGGLGCGARFGGQRSG